MCEPGIGTTLLTKLKTFYIVNMTYRLHTSAMLMPTPIPIALARIRKSIKRGQLPKWPQPTLSSFSNTLLGCEPSSMFSNGSPADTFDENFDSSAFEPSGVFSCSYLPILSQLAIVPKVFAQQDKCIRIQLLCDGCLAFIGCSFTWNSYSIIEKSNLRVLLKKFRIRFRWNKFLVMVDDFEKSPKSVIAWKLKPSESNESSQIRCQWPLQNSNR